MNFFPEGLISRACAKALICQVEDLWMLGVNPG